MAARPELKLLGMDIEARGQELGMSGDDWFFGEIENGQTVTKLAALLDVSRSMIYYWIRKVEGRDERLKLAKRTGAHAFAEAALEVAEQSSEDTKSSDRLKVQTNQWMAERWNKPEYSILPSAGMNVNITLHSLHMDALKALNAKPLPSDVARESIEEVEVKRLASGE